MRLELVGADHAPGITVEVREVDHGRLRWSVANEGREPVPVERVRVRWRAEVSGPVRVLRQGWQSWSATGGGVLGRDEDPSRARDSIPLVRGIYHADASITDPGELRSELVTVLSDDDGAACLGFDGGARHDGTFRLRETDEAEVVAEAYLGGAVLAPGERRELHPLAVELGHPATLLDRWAAWAGSASGARRDAPYRVGWCSWYQYFHDVTEEAFRANLARAADWPVDVFQLDDGYQAAIGDWLSRADTFPSPLEGLAADIAAAGYVPGIWLAPFLAAPGSHVATQHPDWVVEHAPGQPLVGMVNPEWGGAVWVLDTTRPDVLAHLEGVARTLVEMGWRYLKLDFTYAPSFGARWHDRARTPAQRVRAGYDAIRRGAGDDVFVLGCGAPLGPCIGAVDGMRIGPDVAPRWHPAEVEWRPPGYEDCEPATVNAWRNTLSRSFQHRRLWVNDPDCLMLRSADTSLTTEQVDAWALAVAASGGMALLSDDLALLDASARRHFAEVLAIGRAVDDGARAGVVPRCPDVLDAWTPTTLVAGDRRLVGDPERGTARLL